MEGSRVDAMVKAKMLQRDKQAANATFYIKVFHSAVKILTFLYVLAHFSQI
jgi:hypothetical protein